VCEFAWLAAAVLIPITFDPLANQAFELPKLVLLSGLSLVSAIAAMVGLIQDRHGVCNRGMAAIALLWLASVVVATLRSSNITDSIWGSYDRNSGAVLAFALVALGAGPWAYLRSAQQLERILIAVFVGSIPVVLYALLQRAGLDSIGWIGRPLGVTSTLGSSTALGGYLAMMAPIGVAVVAQRSTSTPLATWSIRPDPWRVAAAGLLGLMLVALLLTSVRAAFVGCIVGLLTFFIVLEIARQALSRRIMTAILGALLIMGFGVIALSVFRGASADVDRATLPRSDTSLSERFDLWRTAQRYLIASVNTEPIAILMGVGPDQQASRLELWLQPSLPRRLPSTQFDRVHLSPADVLITTGLFGLLSISAMFVIALVTIIRHAMKAGAGTQALLAGICGSVVGFLAESSVSFPSVTSLTLVALLLGSAAGISARGRAPASSGQGIGVSSWPWTVMTALLALVLLVSLPRLAQELRSDHAFQRSLAYAANEELSAAIEFAEAAFSMTADRDVYAAHLGELLLQRAESAPRDDSSRPEVLDREPGIARLLERAVAVTERPRSSNPFMFMLHARALDERLDAGGWEREGRDEAVQAASRAADLAPRRVDLKDALARLLLKNGDPTSALRVYADASDLDPAQSQRLAEMGHAHRALGDIREAQRLYDEAIRKDEQSAEAWWGLARIAMENARWRDALEPASQAARYQMRDWRFHRDLGYVHAELGERSAARQEQRAALRLAPSWHWESLRAQVDDLREDR
jgi:tetratricopeptide (TPR) repeat protein